MPEWFVRHLASYMILTLPYLCFRLIHYGIILGDEVHGAETADIKIQMAY